METQKTTKSQSNLEKEQSWRNHAPWLQTILQRYSNKNNKVLAQKTNTQINGTEQKAQK